MDKLRIFIIIGYILLGLSSSIEAKESQPQAFYKSFNCTIDGIERTYKLYIPAGLEPKGAPLVFALHGYGGSNNLDHVGLNQVADKEGFAVCYPRGSKDGRGKNCWNVGYPFQEDMEVDDVSFLCQLARLLQKEYGFSRRNTFCTGMSNGGEMCYLLAYREQKVFAAVAPIAGLTMAWFPEAYSPKRAIPLFELHGTEDRTSEWEGDLDNKGGWGAYLPVEQAVEYWVKVNGCKEKIDEKLPLFNKEANQVIAHRYIDPKRGNDVWLYEIVGGKHTWGTKDIATAAEIWKFFSKYLK